MIVAGKLGLYSLIRFHVGLFPFQSAVDAHRMILLAVVGILYGALVALVQNDLKRLLAFGTISSLSFSTLGIYTFAINGLDGAVFHVLSESITAAALLVLLGLMYERYGTYEIECTAALPPKRPRLATFFVLTMLALIGLPILNGFVGEFLTLSSGFATSHVWGALGTVGVILSAAYMLWMVQRVFYGPNRSWSIARRRTISLRASTSRSGPWPSSWSSWAFLLPTGYAPSIGCARVEQHARRNPSGRSPIRSIARRGGPNRCSSPVSFPKSSSPSPASSSCWSIRSCRAPPTVNLSAGSACSP